VGGCFAAEEAGQIAVCFVEWAVALQVVEYVACYPVERAVQMTDAAAAAEVAGPIVAEEDPTAGSGVDTVGGIGFPCIALGLVEGSLAVAVGSLGELAW